MRDKYESELKELEESERNMQEKYNNMKVSCARLFDFSNRIIFPAGALQFLKFLRNCYLFAFISVFRLVYPKLTEKMRA